MSHEKLSELCPVYALGALDGEELRELETHLKSGCPLCEQQIREFGDLIANVPQALPGIEPSNDLRTRLMAQLDRDQQTSQVIEFRSSSLSLDQTKPPKPRSWLPWACALAAGLALVISLWNLSNLKQELSSQQGQLSRQNDQIQQLQDQLEKERTITAFLSNPEVRVTMLAGTEKSPRSSGKIIWDPKEKRALFYAAHLPAAPPGKTYQLWIIAQNKPFDAGVFSVDQTGNGFLKIDLLSEADKAQKFAVTLEPAGGMPQPTGDMHLLGSL
jgi:anti-sigma-K factor RskA